ncbi:MAG: hypothetical protein QOE25_42 [Actinomycetota bacterium]|nr:hypothetical protein [Actinomycetota bacterium]
MKAARITGGCGLICMLVAAALLLTGSTPFGFVIVVIASVLAVVLLAFTFVLVRRETPAAPAVSGQSSVSRRIVPATVVSAGLGLVAAIVAIAVADGEAQVHAVGHLVIGLGCLSLFALLGFWWRPPTGSPAASFRGLLLALLWAAVAGAFLESLGGSGYDAANSGSRIGFLTSLHGYVAPFGALFLLAAPLGLTTLAAVGVARVVPLLRGTTTTRDSR